MALRKSAAAVRRAVEVVLLALLRIYQLVLSPLLPPSCRFHPTCSSYAGQAIERYGPMRGCFLAIRRICRCHPFHPGGHDPVPEPPAGGILK